MHSGKLIASICCFVVFLALAGGTLYLSLAVLKPSIELSEGIVTTSCLVTSTEDQTTCNNVKCVDQNTDIWWYNSWGPSYFFVYVSGGTGNSDYYDDDGGDGGDDDDDDGGDDDDDDDGGDSGDGDSGGFDSGGGDMGGDSGGGDIGGGDEMKMSKSKLLKAGLLGGSSFGTTGGSEFNGYIPQEIKEKRLERKLQQRQISRSLKAATTNAAPTSGSSYYASSASGCNTCYQGVFYVSYTIGNGSEIDSSIQGLVSSDYTWVSDYIGNYGNGSYYTCYYQRDEPTNVVWFKPPKYNTGSLAGTIIMSVFAFIFLIVGLILFVSAYRSGHHHHNSHHSSTKKHVGVAYKPIANPTPISAKKGNYQSYHMNNGSYHGGYSSGAPSQNTQAAPAYYQYNQGVAQIDFSANNNTNGSINFINAPPSYSN
ncbi:hypothetical protein ACTA71_000735 [Dictyostelium dimigraforme]